MKQLSNTLLFLLWAFATQAQTEFSAADSLARSFRKNGYPTPDALAKALCKSLKTDREKARAIFTWVATNVRYDLNGLDRDPQKFDTPEEGRKQKEKMIQSTYQKGKGICMDYSNLYKKMADAVGLECVFIAGNSKRSVRGGWASHAWNAVKINGMWQLLDATWGAGYMDDDNKFLPVFQPGFFFSPPRIFALDHFPNDEKWQLLETPVSKKEFKNQSSFFYGDPLQGITDAEPFGQPLVKAADGKMELRLKIQKPPSVIQLKMGNRDIPTERSEKDGWLTLRFAATNGRELEVWGGEKEKNGIRTTLIGVFNLR